MEFIFAMLGVITAIGLALLWYAHKHNESLKQLIESITRQTATAQTAASAATQAASSAKTAATAVSQAAGNTPTHS